MATAFRPRTLVLFAGDIFFFSFALWLSLTLRSFEVPSQDLFLAHMVPFSYLFAGWVLLFFIAGLYESRSIILARRAFSVSLLVTQTLNIAVAAIFFFFTTSFGIAPKTLLVIYLAVSFLLVLFWRTFLYPRLGLQKPEPAVVVGEGAQLNELVHALHMAPRAPARIAEVIAPTSADASSLKERIEKHGARIIIADFSDPRVSSMFPELYNFLFKGLRFFDSTALYEEVFGRVPLSALSEEWLARHISRYAHMLYDTLKRLTDIVVSFIGGVISLAAYPFIMIALLIEDGFPLFVSLERIGEDGKVIHIRKFRTMTGNDGGNYGAGGTSKLKVTRVGKVLRVASLDELPQFWNILRGDLSLIGPRPETPALVELYSKEIPYYGVRHLIKPGLSGWAQIYHHNDPHHAAAIEATKEKLSYDLYYLKHRSLVLDITIMLKTLKKLFFRRAV